MEDPDETEDNTANDDPFEAHYEKADAHQQRNGNHNAQFGLSRHATACYKVFEIILIEFGSLKPGVQFSELLAKQNAASIRKGKVGSSGRTAPMAPRTTPMQPRMTYKIFLRFKVDSFLIVK